MLVLSSLYLLKMIHADLQLTFQLNKHPKACPQNKKGQYGSKKMVGIGPLHSIVMQGHQCFCLKLNQKLIQKLCTELIIKARVRQPSLLMPLLVIDTSLNENQGQQ